MNCESTNEERFLVSSADKVGSTALRLNMKECLASLASDVRNHLGKSSLQPFHGSKF